jgi:hypothetical protein
MTGPDKAFYNMCIVCEHSDSFVIKKLLEVGLKLRFVLVEAQVGTVLLKWHHLKSGFF